jgi:hypothetical protein
MKTNSLWISMALVAVQTGAALAEGDCTYTVTAGSGGQGIANTHWWAGESVCCLGEFCEYPQSCGDLVSEGCN